MGHGRCRQRPILAALLSLTTGLGRCCAHSFRDARVELCRLGSRQRSSEATLSLRRGAYAIEAARYYDGRYRPRQAFPARPIPRGPTTSRLIQEFLSYYLLAQRSGT